MVEEAIFGAIDDGIAYNFIRNNLEGVLESLIERHSSMDDISLRS